MIGQSKSQYNCRQRQTLYEKWCRKYMKCSKRTITELNRARKGGYEKEQRARTESGQQRPECTVVNKAICTKKDGKKRSITVDVWKRM